MDSGASIGPGTRGHFRFNGGWAVGDNVGVFIERVVSGSPEVLISSGGTISTVTAPNVPFIVIGLNYANWAEPPISAGFVSPGPAEGDAVQVTVNWFASGGALRATNTTVGFNWRAASGLWNIERYRYNSGGSDSTLLQEIHDAVIRTFPPS
jgi:hypothetical protein